MMELVIYKKPSGNLIDCLNLYSKVELQEIARNINVYEEVKNLKKNELVDYLNKKILESFPRTMYTISGLNLEQLEMAVDKEKIIFDEFTLVSIGVLFYYEDKRESGMYIPNDLAEIYKKKINIGVWKNAWLNDVALLSLLYFNCYGLVKKNKIVYDYERMISKDVDWEFVFNLLNKNFEFVTIKKEEYLWPRFVPLVEAAKKNVNVTYAFREMEELISNFARINIIVANMADTFGVDYAQIYGSFIEYVLISPRNIKDIIADFAKEYNFNAEQLNNLQGMLNDFGDIYYWQYGGQTKYEHDVANFWLPEIPKKKNLKDCLKKLNKKALSVLEDYYGTDSLEVLEHSIIKNFTRYIDLDPEFDADSLLYVDNEFFDMVVDPKEVCQGFYFLYNNAGEKEIVLPLEIEEIISKNNFTSDFFMDGLINAYLYANGVIKRKDLQKIMRDFHNINYTLKELDALVRNTDAEIDGEYYSLVGDNPTNKAIILERDAKYGYKEINLWEMDCFFVENALPDKIVDIMRSVHLSNDTKDSLAMMALFLLHMGTFSKNSYKQLLADYDIKISVKIVKEIIDFCNNYKNDVPLWGYGGYTKNEINEMLEEVK